MRSLRAPAKINLWLRLGPARDDGLHEIRSLFCPLELSDRIEVREAEGPDDVVVCEGVESPNLAASALAAMRDAGWENPPLELRIEKRIPVAAGLGGGSADAAAVLRMAGGLEGLERIAMSLGADVPSQLVPAFSFVGGVGERVERLPPPAPFGVVLIPFEKGLATGEVYAEADRLGLGRPAGDLDEATAVIRAAAEGRFEPLGRRDLLVNDLEPAAVSLRPEIGAAIGELREVGAAHAFVTGSGPTAVGLFEDIVAADRAAATLPPAYANAIVTASAPSS